MHVMKQGSTYRVNEKQEVRKNETALQRGTECGVRERVRDGCPCLHGDGQFKHGDDRVRIAGDDLLVERQKAEEKRTRGLVQDVKERGFWLAAWPSVLAALVNIGLWFLIIWAFVAIVR